MSWLIEEGGAGAARSSEEITAEVGARRRGRLSRYAVKIHDVVIHDNRKWFGDADIRLDALVVNGAPQGGPDGSCYQPGTFRFARIGDGESLPIGDPGLLLFLGQPQHFLDVFIAVSRDTRDSDDLAALLVEAGRSDPFQSAAGGLAELITGGATAGAVSAGLQAAAMLGNLSYQVLQKATSKTVGLYRASWLQNKDRFGQGRHPDTGSHRVKDLSFWFQIVQEA